MLRGEGNTAAKLISRAGKGEATVLADGTMRRKISGDDSSGQVALVEYTVPPHSTGAASHWHARTTEVCYVTNGTLAFALGDETVMASAGTSILVPAGVVHTFWNPTAAPATVLIWVSPPGCEEQMLLPQAPLGAECDTFAADG